MTWTTGGMRGWAPTARTATPSCGMRTASRVLQHAGRDRGHPVPGGPGAEVQGGQSRLHDGQPRRRSRRPCSTTASWPCWRPVPGIPTLLKNNAPDLQVGIAPIPVAKAGMKHVTAFWPDAVMMFKQSKHPKEAAKFLEWMYGKENRLLFAKQRGVIPERIDVGTRSRLRGRRHREVLRRAAPDRQERLRDAVPRTPSSRSTPRPRTWWPARWRARSPRKRR